MRNETTYLSHAEVGGGGGIDVVLAVAAVAAVESGGRGLGLLLRLLLGLGLLLLLLHRVLVAAAVVGAVAAVAAVMTVPAVAAHVPAVVAAVAAVVAPVRAVAAVVAVTVTVAVVVHAAAAAVAAAAVVVRLARVVGVVSQLDGDLGLRAGRRGAVKVADGVERRAVRVEAAEADAARLLRGGVEQDARLDHRAVLREEVDQVLLLPRQRQRDDVQVRALDVLRRGARERDLEALVAHALAVERGLGSRGGGGRVELDEAVAHGAVGLEILDDLVVQHGAEGGEHGEELVVGHVRGQVVDDQVRVSGSGLGTLLPGCGEAQRKKHNTKRGRNNMQKEEVSEIEIRARETRTRKLAVAEAKNEHGASTITYTSSPHHHRRLDGSRGKIRKRG